MKDLGNIFLSSVARASLGLRLFPEGSAKNTSITFKSIGTESDYLQYLAGACFLSAFVASMVLLLCSLVISLEALDSFAAFLLAFAASFSIFLYLPSAMEWKMTERIESELPFLLREFSIYLGIGIPFEKCMEKIAKRDYTISPSLSRAHKEVKSGATVQGALAVISSERRSMPIKRSTLLLSSIYETGSSPEPLKRMAEELSAAQLSQMRTESSRLQLIAILFVASSALVPSFFAVFIAVSPLVSFQEISDAQIWLAFLLAFPLLNALCLGAISFLLPHSMQQPQESGEIIDEFLTKRHFPYGQRTFILLSFATSALFTTFFLIQGQFILALLSICIAPALYMAASYFSMKEIRSSESFLPDALYSAASVHRLLSAERMLSSLAKGGFGRLSESFRIALSRQKAGESFSGSMAAAGRHCPSLLTKRAFDLLTVAYETGADMHAALRESAQDVVSFFTLVHERAAMLAMQRYTVMAASALLVPLIIGTIISIVPSLAISSSLSGEAPNSPSAIPALVPACQVYLLINSLLSSLLLGFSESNLKKSALYFPLIASLSQVAFAFASQGGLSLFAI